MTNGSGHLPIFFVERLKARQKTFNFQFSTFNFQLKMKILFICLGNICRSPMAQIVFQNLVNKNGLDYKFEIDSAGTAAGASAARTIPSNSGVSL